jgi:hypothetical protein
MKLFEVELLVVFLDGKHFLCPQHFMIFALLRKDADRPTSFLSSESRRGFKSRILLIQVGLPLKNRS